MNNSSSPFVRAVVVSTSWEETVPDQVGTPSQVGTKKILKGGLAISELFELCRNHDFSLRSQSGWEIGWEKSFHPRSEVV